MKLLLISNMYPNEKNPSYGTFVRNHVEVLKNRDVDIDLVVMFKIIGNFKRILYYFLHYIRIFLQASQKKHDVIYIHFASLNAFPLLILNKISKIDNLVVNIHGSDLIPESALQRKLSILTGKIVKIADLVVVPSEYYAAIIRDKYNLSDSNIFISPSGGINKDIFYDKENKSDTENLVLGYVGRIDTDKGWDDVLLAFSELVKIPAFSSSRLVMAGSGRQVDARNNLIEKLNLHDHVNLHDFLSHEELSDLYNSLDVFLFPTKRQAESLGLVGLEAMACGVPVLGSEIGGLKSYLINDYNGYFFEPGNPKDLYEKIVAFYKLDSLKRNELRRNALNTAEDYELNKVGNELIDYLYQRYTQ